MSQHNLYSQLTILTDNMKKNAISYGNCAYILLNEENVNYVNKIYDGSIRNYGERVCYTTEYPEGFLEEMRMYRVTKNRRCTFVPELLSHDKYKLTITIQYLRDYISLSDYITQYYENCNQMVFFHSLFKLLDSMKEKSFVHGNINISKIMIHPTTMDMKLIDLKHSFIACDSKKPHIFTYERNHILYDIFQKIHPEFSSLFHGYFKYRNPDYYTSDRILHVGEFYDIAVSNLFQEFDDPSTMLDNQFVDFIRSFIHFRDNVLNMNPFAHI